ncbi:MAG: family 16 glycosylhydrolase [Bacteroidales bacterium]
MNNKQLKIRFQTFSRLGLIPDALKIEKRENELREEYEKIIELGNSNEIKRFEDLKTFIESPEFKIRKKEINFQKYSDTKEYQKEQRFKKLSASKAIKNYLKLKDSEKLAQLNELLESGKLQQFIKLEDFFKSPDFKEFKKNLKKEKKGTKFGETQEYKDLQEYKRLKKSPEIKKARKLHDSKEYELYTETKNSEALKEYYELYDYINSDEFKKFKKQLTSKNKFKYSQEYQDLQEYKRLKKSENIKWYYKRKDSEDFDFFRKWERTFYDDFQDNKIDKSKWLTMPYWGKVLLKDSYVQTDDNHFFTNGNNLEINGNILNVITKREDIKGKVWHPKFGFYLRQFQYSSGIINTGESFRQKYGLFRAKVRIEKVYPFKHAFWLNSERISPEVDVFSFMKKSTKTVSLISYWGELSGKNTAYYDKTDIKGPDFSSGYYIFSLEWYKDELIWKINDMTVRSQKKGIPDIPMYMILNSGLQTDAEDSDLPSRMLIDWVEVYQEK